MIIKPYALSKGDRVAVIAPSSPCSKERTDLAESAVRSLGLTPVMYPSCYARHGHFAGHDTLRAQDIHDAFADASIKGIICLKGGYGTPRLLPLLNYDIIRSNPKLFIGYSDITGLHMALNRHCRMITYHGPMAAAGFIDSLDSYTLDYLEQCLFGHEPLGSLPNPPGEALGALVPGKAVGEIIGGNLALLVSTLGSPYEIDAKDKILFIEDVGEANYRVDRMLTSLALAGKFRDCRGLILGTWSGCEPDVKFAQVEDLSLDTIFEEVIKPYGKPTLTNFRAGHNYPQPSFPMGVQVEIDADNMSIRFLEAGNRARQATD